MIVSFNFYYARPGQEEAVLRQRLRACDVRQSIGIPRGRVLARTAGAPELPDVIWEHHFDEIAGHHADMAARAASPEFEAIRAGMRKLYRRFERPLFEVCGAAGQVPEAAANPGVVTLDWFFCTPEKAGEALELERHTRRGSADGRLLRLITPGSDLPDFVWQQAEAAGRDVAPTSAPANAYAQRVERSVWKVV